MPRPVVKALKHLAPVAALALATLSTTWFFSGTSQHASSALTTDSQGHAGRAPAGLASAAQSPAALLQIQYQPREGRRYLYSFERRITIRGLPTVSNAPAEVAYHGQLELDVIKSSSQGFEALVRAHLSEHPEKTPVTLKVQLSAQADRMEIFGAPLHSEKERQESAILKDLLALWSFNLREDTVGTFEARFESNPLKKTKLTYLESKTQTGPLPKIVNSEHFLGWDEYRSLPHEISGHETTKMGQSTAAISAESQYQILLLKDQALPASSARLASKLTEQETLALSLSRSPRDAIETGPDWATLRSELLALDQQDSSAQLKVFGDLVRYAKSHEGAAAELLDLLRAQGVISLGVDSALFRTVVGSLISSGTAEGQLAALKIYSDPSCPVAGKGAILSALTTTQAPLSPATQDFLASTMRNEPNGDLAKGASYALGASIQNSSEGSGKADAIEALRQTWLASGSRLPDQLAALDAMGNSGQASYLPELQSVIGNPDAASALRAKAVFSLRFIRSGEATDLLAQSLSAADFQIRLAAARAIGMASWSESFRKPLQSCASSDPMSSIQTLCRSVLESSDPKLASN